MTQEEFEEKLAREQAAGFKARMEKQPGIGVLPNGELNIIWPLHRVRHPPHPLTVHAPPGSDDDYDISDIDDYDHLL